MIPYLGLLILGLILGFILGVVSNEARRDSQELERKNSLLPGMRVFADNLGEVLVLGYGTRDGVQLIDYVPVSLMHGKEPHQIPLEELDQITISAPVQDFLAHVDYKRAARFV